MKIEKDAVKSFIYRIKEDINHVFKEVTTISSQLGELSGLKTTEKSNLVAAINEQNTKIAIKHIELLSISVTTKESTGTLGGYYAMADISKNTIAQSAKIIIPLGGCRADNVGGYAAVASPYLSSGAGLACKLWAVNSASADTYLMSFACFS